MAINAAKFVQVADKMAAMYRSLKGSVGNDEGLGDADLALGSDWGFSKYSRQLTDIIVGSVSIYSWADAELIEDWIPVLLNLQTLGTISRQAASFLYQAQQRLDQSCRDAELTGVTDANTFATYMNTGAGGPYAALVSPEFLALWNLLFATATTPFDIKSVYAPTDVLTDMAHRSFGGSFTAGTVIDTDDYAGAARIKAVITGYSSGGATTLTVNAKVRKADGTLDSTGSRTFTVSVPNTASQTLYLTPTVAGDLAYEITGITLPAGMTAGTITIAADAPSGRTYPAT